MTYRTLALEKPVEPQHRLPAQPGAPFPLAPAIPEPPLDRVLVKGNGRYLFVKLAAIQWLEAEDNYVRLHVEARSHLVRQTMSGLLARLDPLRFRRIHRSAIVNLDFVAYLEPWTGGDFIVFMLDGTRLTLSRTYRDSFAEWM